MKIIMLSTDNNIFKQDSEVRNRMFEYGKLVEELHIIIKTKNLKQETKKVENVFIYTSNTIFGFNTYNIAKSIIKDWKSDIKNCLVTCQDPFETGLIGYFLKRNFKIKLHIQIHTDFLSPYFKKESLKNKIRVLFSKRIIPKADGIRVVSERIKKTIISNFRNYPVNKILVLPIFVDLEKIKNTPIKTDLHNKYKGKFIVLMASRLTIEKNINLAIRSIKNLISKHTNLLLVIVGSGSEKRNIESQIINLKLQDNIVLEDWSYDLVSYYKTADLFLLTSNYEGYGMSVVEASAAGLPVLMTDVGVSIGCVIPVGSLEKITESLNILIKDNSGRKRFLENQNIFLNSMPSKIEYLNLIKKSWQNCFL